MAKLANKDLTCQMTEELPEAYHALRDDFNHAVDTLHGALQAVGQNAASIDSAANEVSPAASELSKRTEQQAGSVEETAAALDQITATVKNSAQSEPRKPAALSPAPEPARRRPKRSSGRPLRR